MSPHGSGGKRAAPLIIGSSTSGVLEILIFHPIDTVAKRMMSNTTTVFGEGRSFGEGLTQLSKTIFGKAYEKNYLAGG